MRRCAVLAAILAAATQAGSWPVLGEGRQTPAGWCYPDHEDHQLWWLIPATAEILNDGGRPDVHMTVYNYTGSREMSDLGDLRTGAVLQFAVAFPSAGARLAEAKRSLGNNVRVQPLLPETMEAEVVFAGVNSARTATSSSDDGTEGAATWSERRFSIGLTPEETAVVTEAWQHGSIIISVNVTASARTCTARPLVGVDAAPELSTILSDSISVALDASHYAEAVRVIELGATMPAGYTSLEVGCTELDAGRGYSDLSFVVVTIEAEAMNGDTIGCEVQFSRGSRSTQVAHFDRAVRLDPGYVLRVSRVYATGRIETEPPRRIEVWQGFEDVCSINPARADTLDPRMLY